MLFWFHGKLFSFETVAVGGVSYKFSGALLDNIKYNSYGDLIGDVLQRHLIKVVNGKKAVEADLKFGF